MKRALALIAGAALLALGVWSAVALGAGNDQRETSTVATTTTTTTTGETTDATTVETTDTTTGETADTTTGETTDTTTGETADTTTGETTDTTTGETKDTTAAAASKVWVCHHTGSWKHPYHLIHISTHALHAHLRNVDVPPGPNNSCPTSQPAEAKTHGHGKGHGARPSGHGYDQNEATETNDD
jgi:hypothetical protein